MYWIFIANFIISGVAIATVLKYLSELKKIREIEDEFIESMIGRVYDK
jgi:hypothetical protein